jgi:serine/threonine protein kinase/tetratricopeptide (TPR) repeat protein
MAQAELIASRYEVIRTLGSGGMGVVYLVEDLRQQRRQMALKTLHAVGDPEAVASFQSEFRNLRGVVHPHIPEMYDFGTIVSSPATGGAPMQYFTSEFVEGQPLHELRDVWEPAQLHEVIVAMARALAFLHGRGMLHRDIKPENVLARLSAEGNLELLKLVDFGLATHMSDPRRSRTVERAVSGTIDYLAPEIINGGAASIASDLYAFGTLLFKLVTGRLPFASTDPIAATKAKTTHEAPPPLHFRPRLSVGLSDLISSLLRLNPAERPASARRVISLLNEREGTEFPFATLETRIAYIRSATSFSNLDARARLTQLKKQLESLNPLPVIVRGPRGLGRVRLIREFASELTIDGQTVRVVTSDGDLDATDPVRVLLVPDDRMVTAAWLHRVLEVACQTGVWCIVGQAKDDPELVELLGRHECIALTPLTVQGTTDALKATFPESVFPDEFARELHEWTVGFPAAIRSTLETFVHEEVLQVGLHGWELQPGHRRFRLHGLVAAYLLEALTRLPKPGRYLLNALALSPAGLPESTLPELAELSSMCDADCAAVAQALIDRGLVGRYDSQLRIASRAVAEVAISSIDDAETNEWHRRLYALWQAQVDSASPDRAWMMLHHDINAGTWQCEAAAAAAVIEQLIDARRIQTARSLLEQALELRPPTPIVDLARTLLARIAFIEGRFEAAVDTLRPLVNDGEVAASADTLELLSRFAMIEEKLGRSDHAEQILQRCQTALPPGQSAEASAVYGTLAWIAFKRGDAEHASRLAEEGLVRVPPDCRDAGHALLLNTVGTLAFYRGDVDAAALAWERCLEVNEAIQDRKGIANMYNNLGVLAAQSGERLRARALWEKCAAIATEINDVHRLAGINNNLGIDALESGQLAEAEEHYLKSLALFRVMKSPREQVATLSNLGELSLYRADFDRAQAYFLEAIALADKIGDAESKLEPLIYFGKLLVRLDEREQAARALDTAKSIAEEIGAKKNLAQALEGLAMLAARAEQFAEAHELLGRAEALMTEDDDPLALIHLHLTVCAAAAAEHKPESVADALQKARKAGESKWDPFAAARTLVYGLLFAREQHDPREMQRLIRKVAVYPDYLWQLHWGLARQLSAGGAVKRALEEYGRGVAVLKSISARLSDDHKQRFLSSPAVSAFKYEAVQLRTQLQEHS